MRRIDIELGGIRAAETADVTGELNHRALHAEADAEERDLVGAGVFDRLDHAFNAALAEATRNEDGVNAFEAPGAVLFDIGRIDVLHLHVGVRRDAGVDQGFVQRLVGIRVVNVLPDHRDRDRAVLRLHVAVNDVLPLAEIGFLRLMPSFSQTISSRCCSCRISGTS